MYFEELLTLADLPALNWAQKVNAVDKPNAAVLRWSYYNGERKYPVHPSGEFVKRYEPFFEQLKYELKLLATKVKI